MTLKNSIKRVIKGKDSEFTTTENIRELLKNDFGYTESDVVKQNTYGRYYTYVDSTVTVCVHNGLYTISIKE